MEKVNLYISKEAPNVKGRVAWLKPVDGGFAFYVLDGGWKSLNIVNSNAAPSVTKEEIVGTTKDRSTDLTLNGLKKYIDEQLEALG